MTDSLGLSIGTTHLVAARTGRQALSRSSVLTLFDRRAPEVGTVEENPNLHEPGLAVRGFVQRVGDPVPLVASDGSTHRGEHLLAEALDALAQTAGYGQRVAIAVPAHWGPRTVDALRTAVDTRPNLRAGGLSPPLISDSAAAIAALYAEPGLPADGIIALCDFGGSGSSITLVDAASNFVPIAETVRYDDFSGERIDEDIVGHVLATIRSDTDPASTAAVGSLTRLRNDCRLAKERLSGETTAAIPVELPGFTGDVPLTRTELDAIIAAPLAGFLTTVTDTVARNRVAPGTLSAVAMVGGGAGIPLVAAQLSERLQRPVITRVQPALAAAIGARALAEQGPPTDNAAAAEASAPTGMAPTSMAPAPWAAGAGALESTASGAAALPELAWSQEADGAEEPVPYTGEDYGADTADTADAYRESGGTDYGDFAPLAWYRRPAVLFTVAAAAVLAALFGLIYTLTDVKTPIDNHIKIPGRPAHDDQVPTTTVVTVTAPNGETQVSTSTFTQPPPSSTSDTSAPETTTEPATTSKEPTTTSKEPATTSKEPATTSQAPATTKEAPATSNRRPTSRSPEPTAPETPDSFFEETPESRQPVITVDPGE
jgi:hypothetical protein